MTHMTQYVIRNLKSRLSHCAYSDKCSRRRVKISNVAWMQDICQWIAIKTESSDRIWMMKFKHNSKKRSLSHTIPGTKFRNVGHRVLYHGKRCTRKIKMKISLIWARLGFYGTQRPESKKFWRPSRFSNCHTPSTWLSSTSKMRKSSSTCNWTSSPTCLTSW